MIQAAIVGLGAWGQRLVDSVQRDGQPRGTLLRFTRAAVPRPERVAAFCRAQRLLPESFEDALADPAIDALVIATPHGQHPAQVAAAAAAGKHVFVEKPLALRLAEARAAISACAAAGVVLALGHNRRFLPAFDHLRESLAAGEIGDVLHADALFAGGFALAYQPGMWRASPADSPAGGLTAMGIHSLDALVHLLGPVARVSAQSLRRIVSIPMDDTTTAMLRFTAGPSGHVTTLMATAWTWQLRVFGARGFIEMPSETDLRVVARSGAVRTATFPPADPERAELEAFARAILGRVPYPVALPEVEHGIAVLEAILASIGRDGQPVDVADMVVGDARLGKEREAQPRPEALARASQGLRREQARPIVGHEPPADRDEAEGGSEAPGREIVRDESPGHDGGAKPGPGGRERDEAVRDG